MFLSSGRFRLLCGKLRTAGVMLGMLVFTGTMPTLLCGQNATNVGTDFWIAFPTNASATAIKIFISSEFSTSGQVSSAFPGVNQNFTVVPGIVTEVVLPTGVQANSGIQDRGIHVTSLDAVSVYGLNRQNASTDAFMALPTPSLGTDYRVMSYKVAFSTNGSALTVVATQPGTQLTIFNHQTSSTSTQNLDQGQTYYLEDGTLGNDLTGSRVESNLPVAVYGSVRMTQVPYGCAAADHIVEQMWPVTSWGKDFVTVATAGRDNSGDIFRVLAKEDNSVISVNGTVVATLNTGDHYETTLTGNNSFHSTKAVMLTQFAKGFTCSGGITGDPFMMIIPPQEQFLTNYTIGTVTGFTTHWANIVAPAAAVGLIYEDGVLIPSAAFTAIGSTGFYGAQRSIVAGPHTYNSTFPFGVFVYGWGMADSYGYPGGGSMSAVATVDTVLLTPDTLYGQLNVTNVCLTATVLNSLTAPVPNILVNFYVQGLGTQSGTAYTDASGTAQFCYTQTGTMAGNDYVHAVVSGLTSDTSVVIWSYTPPCTDPTDGGSIGQDQSGCGTYTPQPLQSISLPTGYSGNLEYKWQVSVAGPSSGFSDIAASNSPNYSPGPVTQTSWFRRLARVDCKQDWSGAAATGSVQLTVVVPLAVGVSISASTSSVCAGTAVDFTAIPINPGSAPVYQWKVNGGNAGSNSPLFSYVPSNGDNVWCIMTSSETCTSGNPATSNQQQVTVNPIIPVSVSITASATTVCAGTQVNFSAAGVNPGSTPVYQWLVNSVPAGGNSPSYSYVPMNGDIVSCMLTSSLATCTVNNPATSNQITETVNPLMPVGVSVTASATSVCAGTSVTFTAAPVNPGAAPIFQWKVNSVPVGGNNPAYTYVPVNSDIVWCVLTSSETCAVNNPTASNQQAMNVKPLPYVAFTSCFDTITTVSAQPFLLRGGIPSGGSYSGTGVNPVTGYFNPSSSGTGNVTVTYSYTDFQSCSDTRSVTLHVLPAPAAGCGQAVTDPRDGKTYPTVLIGSQCWMQKNLDYGTMISAVTPQNENCVPEKYCPGDDASKCQNFGGLYQWDELMKYAATEGLQGVCLPGWHVPSMNDWMTLVNFYQGSGLAGKPLQDSIISGMRILESGVNYSNGTWKFAGFGTLLWTSTASGAWKALSHGMNNINYSVSDYISNRSNGFPVRCLRDY